MKLTELKQATRHLHLVDLDHEFTVGKTQYEMGIDISSCRNDSQRKGWTVGKRDWENLLRRNNCDGQRTKLWM